MTVHVLGVAGKHKVLQNLTAGDGGGGEFEAGPKQEAGMGTPVDATKNPQSHDRTEVADGW